MKKEKSLPKHLTPDGMKEAQQLKTQAIRAWAADNGIGSKPASIPEISFAPKKSAKNIKR